jgi:phytoene dehydrogenase-like protein
MSTVAIVGGGLAGLVAARHLAADGVDVQLFERREAFGGRVGSTERDGFVFDEGFQVLLTDYPAARRELDYEGLDLRRFPPGLVVAGPNRRSTLVDPLRRPSELSTALFSRAASTRDKLRLLTLRRELGRTPEEGLLAAGSRTIREGLAERGFSESFVEDVVAPLYGGITLDRSLSTSMAVFRYTFEKFSTGHAAVPATGMGAIPRQLAAGARDAGASLHAETEVEALQACDGEATLDLGGETTTADAAVVATDPPTARELTGVETIPTEGRGCVTQFYSLPAETELPTGGRLLLNAGGTEPNQVVAHSAVAPGHAPVGSQLLSATFLGEPADGDAELAGKTRDALASWFPEMTFDDLEPRHVERVPFAQFAQPPGFRESLPDPDAPDGPVVLAGEYTRWSSIQGALESGRRAAWAAESHC